MDFLHDFEKKSGQCISIAKSSFIVSPKTPLLIKRHIKRITGFVLKPLPFTYLGVPIFVGRKKSEYYERLIEAMGSKIGGWEKVSFLWESFTAYQVGAPLHAYTSPIGD
ncbi:UNVERIFIED_CONTAM: hypothetical protein Slati_3650100 [Sesamum latifolium]|uniref:Reverse transcriptase n=1 Tax=Sesamum latifolium TaxID=2727402 RepID=A0AAW2U0N3_9LAMI